MIIDKVLDIASKFLPDSESKSKFEVEMRRLEIEELKEQGTYIEKVSKCIPLVLPSFLFVLLAMFTIQFLLDVTYSIIGMESPILHIDDRLVEFCKAFMALLLGKKTIEKFGKK